MVQRLFRLSLSVTAMLSMLGCAMGDHNPDKFTPPTLAAGQTFTHLWGYHDQYPGVRLPVIWPYNHIYNTGDPAHAAFTADGRLAAINAPGWSLTTDAWKGTREFTSDSHVYVWNLASGKIVGRFRPDAGALAVALAPDDRRLLLQNRDGVEFRDFPSGELVKSFPTDPPPKSPDQWRAAAAAWSRDGRRAITSSQAGQVCVWDTQALRLLRQWPPSAYAGASADLSPDGRTVALTYDESDQYQRTRRKLVLLDVDSGRATPLALEQEKPDYYWSTTAAFCDEGNHLLVIGRYSLVVCDPLTGRALQRIAPPIEHQDIGGEIKTCSLSRDGRIAVVATTAASAMETIITVWNLDTGGLVTRFKGPKQTTGVMAPAPDGSEVRYLDGWNYYRQALP